MSNPQTQKILKFHRELDREGRTVLRPLTDEDRVGIEEALSNPKGLTFGPTLKDAQDCPLDPCLPFGISSCGIDAESNEARARVRRLARDQWDVGNRDLAERMLKSLEEEQRSSTGG